MTWDQVLREATATLQDAGAADPSRSARRLLAHVLDCDATRLSLYGPDAAPDAVRARFSDLVAQRCRHVPVSQLIGRRSFYGREFTVTADTLDPRPETETLIGLALRHRWSRVLDLGTGTGCILLTLLAERPTATGLGTDLSDAALAVAQGNLRHLDLMARARLVQGDWFDAIPPGTGTFDLIVSNPPYIALDEVPRLSRDVLHEPRLALTDGADGLTAYRHLARHARSHLSPGGTLMVEIGAAQGQRVAELLARAGFYRIAIHPDLDGRDRVVAGTRAQD